MDAPISSAAISAALGIVLSLVFAFVPGLKDWFGKVPSNDKPLVILGFCTIVAIGALALACLGVDIGTGAVCPELNLAVAIAVLANIIAAAGTAQTTFAVLVSRLPKG